MKVLVTGGAGYVGSTICSALLDHGHEPVILDSLVTGRDVFVKDKLFYKGDIDDTQVLDAIFSEHKDIACAIHCAEKAAVDVSVTNPYEYYNSNVVKSIELFRLLNERQCRDIIFCSSASIYDDVAGFMVTENSPVNPRSPFARSKYIMEMILQDFCRAYDMRCITLRYFNPIGADPQMRSGLQARNPHNIVYNLLEAANDGTPFIIHGKDWGTRDGTCIRDYVHIWDVAMAHVRAVENFDTAFENADVVSKGYLPINIGSGIGATVKELVFAFENVTSEEIQIEYGGRRQGDIAGSYANITRAKNTIQWENTLTMEEGILDAIRWEEKKKDYGFS